jgi:predicted nucleic acid-binding protein
LIDINVWLALTWDRHPQHVPASEWYGSIDNAALLFGSSEEIVGGIGFGQLTK